MMHDPRRRATLGRVEDPPLAATADSCQFTKRLRLEPVGPANAADLWLVHNDDEVSRWYDDEKPSFEQATEWATFMGDSWSFHGVHKWIAYDRVGGEVVGRAGLAYAFDVLRVSCTVRHNMRSRAVMERIGMRHRGEIRSRGIAEGLDGAQDDAPFAVCVLLRQDWEPRS